MVCNKCFKNFCCGSSEKKYKHLSTRGQNNVLEAITNICHLLSKKVPQFKPYLKKCTY